MEFKDRLKIARRHAKLTQQQLADAVGITQTSITDLERGKSQSTSYVAEIAKACGIDPLWLATGRGEMQSEPREKLPVGDNTADRIPSEEHANVRSMLQPHREERRYPLISWVAAGLWAESCDGIEPGEAEEWLPSDESAGPCGYWLEVKGKSMIDPSGQAAASFPPGHRILVRPEGFDLVNGKFYIARLRNPNGTWETTFKQYIRDAGTEYLQPLNPSFDTLKVDDNVEIIGRVVDSRPPKSIF